MQDQSVEVALIGGGRRSKILCRILAALPRVRKVHFVSQLNARVMQDWLAADRLGGRVELHSRLDPVIWNGSIAAAVVANEPGQHFATARWLLENGKHVLVEKPFAETRAEAQALIDLAEARGLAAAIGLEVLLASPVHRLKSIIQAEPRPAELVAITWHEAATERQWGAARRPDANLHAVADLLPHAMGLLTVVFGALPAHIVRAVTPQGHSAAELDLVYGTCPARVSLSRVAAQPRRVIEISTRGGPRYTLDLTGDPGTVEQDGRVLLPSGPWDAHPRPLHAVMAEFLDEVADRRGTLALAARRNLHIVEATEDALARARGQEPPVAGYAVARQPRVGAVYSGPA